MCVQMPAFLGATGSCPTLLGLRENTGQATEGLTLVGWKEPEKQECRGLLPLLLLSNFVTQSWSVSGAAQTKTRPQTLALPRSPGLPET